MSIVKFIYRFSQFITNRFLKNNSIKVAKYNPELVAYLYDDISWHILINGDYEKEYMIKAINFFKKINGFKFEYFIDVGANIGTTALNVHNFFDKVISIEANPRTYKILELNTLNIKNIDRYEYAISNRSEKMKLNYRYGSFSGAYIGKKEDDKYQNYKIVESITLNKLLGKINKSDMVIKLDIEGEETNALIGALEIIEKHNPIFIIEINKREINNSSSSAFAFLKKLNYKFYNIQKKYTGDNPIIKRIRWNEPLQIVEIRSLKKKFRLYPTLLCIPNNLSFIESNKNY